MKTSLYYLLLALVILSASCVTKTQSEIDEEIIQTYITEHNLDAQSTSSGLYYVIEKEGTGNYPTKNAYFKISYKGLLIDGTVFDSTETNHSFSFYLTSVIDGWKEGIPKFKKGGKGTLLIPSALGYGSKRTDKIPANSVLIFDIELIDFQELI